MAKWSEDPQRRRQEMIRANEAKKRAGHDSGHKGRTKTDKRRQKEKHGSHGNKYADQAGRTKKGGRAHGNVKEEDQRGVPTPLNFYYPPQLLDRDPDSPYSFFRNTYLAESA